MLVWRLTSSEVCEPALPQMRPAIGPCRQAKPQKLALLTWEAGGAVLTPDMLAA